MVWTWIWRKFSFQDKLFRRNLETVHFCLSSNRLEMSMGLYQINLFQSSNLNWIPTNLKKKPSHVLSWAIACFWNLFIASRILGTVVQWCKCQVAGIFVPPAFFRLRSILYPKSNPCAESSDDTPPSRNGTRIFGSSAFCERDREYLWAVLLMGKFKGTSQQNGTSAQKEMPAKHTWVLLSTVICSPPLPLIIFWSLMGWVGPL